MIEIIQLVLDLIFVFFIIFLLIRTSSLAKLKTLIKESKKDFEKLLIQAEKWSDEIIEKLNLKEKEGKELLRRLEEAHKKLLEEEKKLIVESPDLEKTKSVLLLHNQGLSKEEISKGLNIPIGEVDLILDLIDYIKHKRKK